MANEDNEFHEMASPPCYAHEMDPAYNGTLASQAVLEGMQALLEGERAGARIARESLIEARDAGAPDAFLALINKIQADEITWCKMLMTQTRRHGGTPSTAIGDFYGKTMAIADLKERFTFLNRGQEWVVRKIDELLPQISDPALAGALTEMRDSHDDNIEQAVLTLESI